jgi:hypothetical protein
VVLAGAGVAMALLPRTITGHETNDCNKQIAILADDRDEKNGNASHWYNIVSAPGLPPQVFNQLVFQHGPIKEVGVNGITNEALLVVLIDRFEGFQDSEYACDENELTLVHLRKALEAQQERTRKRIERGVEGTHEV